MESNLLLGGKVGPITFSLDNDYLSAMCEDCKIHSDNSTTKKVVTWVIEHYAKTMHRRFFTWAGVNMELTEDMSVFKNNDVGESG